MGSDGRLRCRAIDGAEQIVGFDIFQIDEEKEFIIVAGVSDSIIQYFHRVLVIRRFKLYFPIWRLFHGGADGLEGGHIDTSAPEHSLFGYVAFPGPDILGGGGNNVHEKALMVLVSAGKQAADGVNSLMLLFEERAQISLSEAFCKVIHAVSDLG
jgi:hypothetical protein